MMGQQKLKDILKLAMKLVLLYVLILVVNAAYGNGWNWSLPAPHEVPAAYLIFASGFIALIFTTIKDFRRSARSGKDGNEQRA